MWSRVLFWFLFILLLLCIVNIAFAQDTNTTNATTLNMTHLEEQYLVIRLRAWVTNVSYWCKGEGITAYDLFGGLAECQHIPQYKECRCTVNLPDDVMPEYFLAYEQIEQRYDDALNVKQDEIGGLWFWIWSAFGVAILSIVSLVFVAKLLPRFRWRPF